MEPVRVECYAGFKADEEPTAVHLQGARLLVTAILDRWITPDAAYFRVCLDDGLRCLLRRDRHDGAWHLVDVSP